MTNLIIIGILAFVLVVSALCGLLRGLGKSRIRGITVLVSAVLAVVLGLVTRSAFIDDALIHDTVLPIVNEMANSELFVEILQISPTLNEVVMNCVASLTTPILCLVYFILLSLISWIIYLIVTLACGSALRRHNELSSFQRLRGMIWGLIQGLAIFVILMVPVASYMEVAEPVLDTMIESEMLDHSDTMTLRDVRDNYVEPANDGLLKAYRTLGGQALVNGMTDFKIGENEVDFSKEIGSVSSLVCNVMQLTENEIAAYGHTEAVAFMAIADSFDQSILLPTMAGELIYSATDKWLQDQAFLGVDRPTMGEMGEILDPFFNVLLEIMHGDARNCTALQADFRTVAEMVSVFAEHGVFANLSQSDALLTSLSSNGIVGSVIEILGKNTSMERLIPEITNLGVRAIAITLGVPADIEAVYGDLLDDVAHAVNAAKLLDENERTAYMTEKLNAAFDAAGVPIDPEIVDYYSASMVADLVEGSSTGAITSEDVQAFFEIFAENSSTSAITQNDSTEGVALRGSLVLADKKRFQGTVYEGKNEEELKKTGAAAMAVVFEQMMTLDDSDPEVYAAAVAQVAKDAYGAILDENSPVLQTVVTVQVTAKPSAETQVAVVALQSADTLVTQKVMLTDLLIDSADVLSSLGNGSLGSEAGAIEAIFDAAAELSKQLQYSDEVNIEQIAGSVGQILDSLNTTASFGSEKTANLFTAVMQSETVRETADIDMKTATQMAQKATEGTPNYTQTMNAVSGSVTIITKLGQDGEQVPEEELIELIRNINPQTAGMIEVYVTPARVESYNVSAKYSSLSAELISKTFHNMANESMSEEQYAVEAKALNQVLNVALSAKEHSGEKHLFTQDGQIGILPGTASETVEIFMSSNAIGAALRDTLLVNGQVKEGCFDAFELGAKLPANSNDRTECENAIAAYYAEHHDEQSRQTLLAIGALFGVDASYILQ